MFEECIKMIDECTSTMVCKHQMVHGRSAENEVACLADFVCNRFGSKNIAKLCNILLAENNSAESNGDLFRGQSLHRSWIFTSSLYRAHLRSSYREDTQRISEVWESLRKESRRGYVQGTLISSMSIVGTGNFLLPFMLNPLEDLTLHMNHELSS